MDLLEEGNKVYAICLDLGISREEVVALQYIYLISITQGIDSFVKDKEKMSEFFSFISKSPHITRTDAMIENAIGLERRIAGDLEIMLKLYIDSNFKDDKIKLYNEKISPKLKEYDDSKKIVEVIFKYSQIPIE